VPYHKPEQVSREKKDMLFDNKYPVFIDEYLLKLKESLNQI
jgi:hypothetical protein